MDCGVRSFVLGNNHIVYRNILPYYRFFLVEKKESYYKPTVWLSAIAFGLIHMIAFSNYSIMLLPYILCVISAPFFAGCAITYYRINLGFWWGVGLHVFNNLPGIIILISQ